MFITYRRTGGIAAAVSLAAAMLTVSVAAVILVIVVSLTAAAMWAARALLPRSWRDRPVAPAAPWPHETLEAKVVDASSSSAERHVRARADGDAEPSLAASVADGVDPAR